MSGPSTWTTWPPCVRAAAGHDPEQVAAVGPERFTYEELVTAVARAVGAQPPILHLSEDLAWLLTLPVGWAVGDTVVTRDEIRGLAAGLLDADGPATGPQRFSDWLRASACGLGRTWASALPIRIPRAAHPPVRRPANRPPRRDHQPHDGQRHRRSPPPPDAQVTCRHTVISTGTHHQTTAYLLP